MKTPELVGAQLDWAVAVSLGHKPVMRHDYMRRKAAYYDYQGDLDWQLSMQFNEPILLDSQGVTHTLFKYSTDWAYGGPIIEKENIGIVCQEFGSTRRCAFHQTHDGEEFYFYGPTVLVAAMRCYVASKLGDEIEIPEELK